MAGRELLTNEEMPLSARLFMLFWLGGWAFGEVAVIYNLYNIFKPLQPAKLVLSARELLYETGTKSFNFNNYNRSDRWQSKPKLFQHMRNKSYQLELDSAKIDQAFVRPLRQEPRSQELLRGMVKLMQGLQVEIVAEGVETLADLDFVTAAGCDLAQGYLIGKPLPATAAETLLRTGPCLEDPA